MAKNILNLKLDHLKEIKKVFLALKILLKTSKTHLSGKSLQIIIMNNKRKGSAFFQNIYPIVLYSKLNKEC